MQKGAIWELKGMEANIQSNEKKIRLMKTTDDYNDWDIRPHCLCGMAVQAVYRGPGDFPFTVLQT